MLARRHVSRLEAFQLRLSTDDLALQASVNCGRYAGRNASVAKCIDKAPEEPVSPPDWVEDLDACDLVQIFP